MPCESIFTDTVQSVLNDARVFEEDYAVIFVDMLLLEIIDDMILFKLLAANSNAAHARYFRFARMMIKNISVLPLHVSLTMKRLVVKTIVLTLSHYPGFSFSVNEHILPMNQTAYAFVKNDHRPVPILTGAF